MVQSYDQTTFVSLFQHVKIPARDRPQAAQKVLTLFWRQVLEHVYSDSYTFQIG